MIKPDFFIVGAPKSGTTALHAYLRANPSVFLPEAKDTHYFARDLGIRFGRIDSLEAYLALFGGAQPGQRVGEASVWYLYSRTAAKEIAQFARGADIVIMLRNPADMLYSQHSQFLYNGNETIEDFAEALAAENDRRAGRRIPPGAHFPMGLLYTDTARYTEQVARYLDAFGRDHVHVVLYDDFKRDTAISYRGVLQFLAVRNEDRGSFPIINANKRARSAIVRRVIEAPPPPIRSLAKGFVPRPLRRPLRRRVKRLNTRYVDRAPMDPVVRAQLQQHFAAEVQSLGKLIERDLSGWLTGTPSATRGKVE